jgi:hypothetical protein
MRSYRMVTGKLVRLPRLVRGAPQRERRTILLDHHDADVVRDDVIKFAGDPGPLRRRRRDLR